MIILQRFIAGLAWVLNALILARILLSWIPVDRNNRLVSLIYEITEPILGPIRRILPSMAGLDLSPLVALLLVEVLQRVALSILAGVR